ncbi:MAG TPA: methyltransferase domain-containing protein [Candidatus Polarisedimenticolaceae bacterium]|nr:methyltransferase domain-containing protein [Candidatus Polarisedimenticolaceae bacterium]
MNVDEYEKLDRIDREHWFYAGKRAVVRHWIARSLALTHDDLLVDVGCGTGTFALEMGTTCRVLGIDHHDESIRLAEPKLRSVGGSVKKSPLERIDLPDGAATVVTAMDVLEHLDDDRLALRELIRIARPGGLIVVTVPALMALWSDWDVALGHRRRYDRRQLLRLIDLPEVDLVRCSYYNMAALPLIGIVRGWRRIRPPAPGADRAEDRVPSRWLNTLLYRSLVTPACWEWPRQPIGVALIAVLKKRAHTR